VEAEMVEDKIKSLLQYMPQIEPFRILIKEIPVINIIFFITDALSTS
jgi:hypothetical protein